MPKDKKSKKERKSSQLVIRLMKSERDAFVKICDTLDTTAAREIRRFMRAFVADHAKTGEADAGDEPSKVETKALAAQAAATEPAKPATKTAVRKKNEKRASSAESAASL